MLVLPVRLLELEDNNFHLVLEGELPRRKKACWIIDTGASKTVFDSNLEDCYTPVETVWGEEYQSAGIGVGTVETRVGLIRKIKFGKLKIKDVRVALIDLSHVNSIYRKYSEVQVAGLLGSDILNNYGCLIDYSALTISFSKKATQRRE